MSFTTLRTTLQKLKNIKLTVNQSSCIFVHLVFVSDEQKTVLVHRKGATRSFGPNHPCLPEKYRKMGQPVLIGGSMGTCSYVLVGTQTAMDISFGSTCHGAGR